MRRRFRVAPVVYADIDEIAGYVAEAAGPQTALRLAERLRDALHQIEKAPLATAADPRLGSGRRRLVVASYLIVYEVDEHDVSVLRIVHGARNLQALFGG